MSSYSKGRPRRQAAQGAGAAGAASIVIVFIAAQLGVEIPGEVGAAIATLLAAGGALLGGRSE
jgi:hypothetical protein